MVGIEGGHDVGMVELGGGPHLLLKPGQSTRMIQQVRIDDLERDCASHVPVLGQIDGAHAALTEKPDHAVARMVGQLKGLIVRRGRREASSIDLGVRRT